MKTATPAGPKSGFSRLGLSRSLLKVLHEARYYEPTPIQAELIPHAVDGKDVIGQAQTGTGKTAAFLLPFFNGWRDDGDTTPQALALVPTRELAVQVCEEARKLTPEPGLRSAALYGGQSLKPQFDALRRGVHLAVGTPGRVIDHIERGTLRLDQIRYVVLDEADRMLDVGFRPAIERILARVPSRRQTLLLSATLPGPVLRLSKRYMTDPVHIVISPETPTVDKIRQSYYTVDKYRKFDLLLRVLVKERPRQCIIFCQRKRDADRLGESLREKLPRVAAMHGDLQQSKRDRIMAGFREGKIVILVATDVVGRGIDVTGISHIINYDLPQDIENYVHRIGRTGRMGKDGIAISFVMPEEGEHLTSIETAVNRLLIEERFPGFEAFRKRERTDTEAAAGAGLPAPKSPPVARFGRPVRRYSQRL